MDFADWLIAAARQKRPGNLKLEAGYLLRRMGEPEPGESVRHMHNWIRNSLADEHERTAEHKRLDRLYSEYCRTHRDLQGNGKPSPAPRGGRRPVEANTCTGAFELPSRAYTSPGKRASADSSSSQLMKRKQ